MFDRLKHMKVIGTAGHIDHGKSTLVHHLTGIDPDRLSEEKARGMTIDLGFAWLRLPSGSEVSIVDVPGHERFVRNMLAGAGGIDVALLVVAADEGVMPQTREHVDILDLLGVRHGVVALTKSDLVDADWQELAAEEVESLLAGTSLKGSPVIPVSIRTGSGVDKLLEALDRAISTAPDHTDRALPYMPVDRVFTVEGFGTVATGTLQDGTIVLGQELEILPRGELVRVRGLQVHKYSVKDAPPGARVALNLAGVARDGIRRGDVLAAPSTVSPTTRFDSRIRLVPDAQIALKSGAQVTLHVGSGEIGATVILLDRSVLEPGEEGWARLRTRDPVAVVRGQRFILRLPAPARTVAGGGIVDVAPPRRIARPRRIERLERLVSDDTETAIGAMLAGGRPFTASDIERALWLPSELVEQVLGVMTAQGRVRRLDRAYIDQSSWETLSQEVVTILGAFHRRQPMRPGMAKEELRAHVRWPRDSWAAAVAELTRAGVVRVVGPDIALPAHRGGTGARQHEAERVLELLQREPFSPPSGAELITAAGTDNALLAALVDEGKVVRLGDGLFLERTAYERLADLILALIDAEGSVTVARVRDAAGTSRKYALALLEYLDGRRITRRVGDARVRGARAPACA